ncbi:MAG: molybdopterin-guanine dinucleotide biosynthesis protein B [Alphaproteobacteria bacterium]|mgnify:CR=1 FL=1
MTKVFGIVGWSGSGKTDLTTRIVNLFVKKKILISTIKHTHHNFEIDKKGKDSFKHIESGANEVILYNEKKWSLISNLQKESVGIKSMIKKFDKKTEIVIIEGLKYSDFPKIEVIRASLGKPLIFPEDKNIKCIVADQKTSELRQTTLPIIEFNQTEKIGNFIMEYFDNAKM